MSGKRGKNDAADAAAICEAVQRPNMRFVPVKTEEQQSRLMVHRARQGFVVARTATINRIRGLMSEFGIVLPQKAEVVRREARNHLEDLPGYANTVIGDLFSSAPQLQYGLRITADFGRKASRSDALNGMGDIDAAQFGGFFNYLVSPAVSLTSSLRYGAGNDHKGMVIDLGANHAMQLAPQWRSAVGVAASFVNANSMQSAFGVTPAQAVTSGYAAYSPGAGFRDVRATASLNYFVNREWAVTGVLSASALTGDARRSPIVRDRSSVTGVLALTREF